MVKREAVVRAALGAGCALLSGLLLALALPLGEQFYLAWIMLVPLLLAVRGKGFVWGFGLALVAIFFAAWLSVEGFFYANRSSDGAQAWNYTTFGIFGWSLAIAVGAWADKASAKMKAWWFAALGVLLEAVLLAGLPAHLALTQYRQSLMLWFASLGGVWLVSFLVWWSNFWLTSWLVAAGRDRVLLRRVGIAAAGVILASIVGSFIRFSPSGRAVKFGVVQIQEPDEDKMAAGQRQAVSEGAVLTVWPEFSAIPFARTGHLEDLDRLSSESSFVTCFEDDFQPLPHNVASLFRNGLEEERYFKRKLFGSESKMHCPGTQAVSAAYEAGRAGMNICFDSCYPEVIRDTARLPGVDVLCLPSIDPVAPNNFVSAMHAAYTPFRAAEEGIAMVKCDGSAYSVFVDSYGQIVKQLPPGDRVDVASVPVGTHWTLYRRAGDWFLIVAGILFVVGLFGPPRARSASTKRLESESALALNRS